MTHIPARILRPLALSCASRPRPTQRDAQRRAYILEAAQAAFEVHGRAAITLQAFADATGLAASTIRREIIDLHHLFHLVLARHLDAILDAVGRIPGTGPEALARRRAAYRAATTTLGEAPSPLHRLFLRDRFTLPPDQLDPLEQQRRIIGQLVGAGAAEAALALLDCPTLSLAQIEAMLAAAASPELPAPAPREARAIPTQVRPSGTIPLEMPFRIFQRSPEKTWGEGSPSPQTPRLDLAAPLAAHPPDAPADHLRL